MTSKHHIGDEITIQSFKPPFKPVTGAVKCVNHTKPPTYAVQPSWARSAKDWDWGHAMDEIGSPELETRN